MPVICGSAERRNAAGLEALKSTDRYARPPGRLLTPRMVETIIMGSDKPVGGPAQEVEVLTDQPGRCDVIRRVGLARAQT
ncbi:MAG: hypothetical protein HRF43_20490 [Phycisphaerae bacterium]|jgi:hypothetical protein